MCSAGISVIIPAFNAGAFIRQTLESCLEQWRKPVEIIVIDDNSQDGTVAVVKRFKGRVKLLRNKTRKGPGFSRNKGIRQARGEIIALVDADDILLPWKLAVEAPQLDDKKVSIVHSAYFKCWADGRVAARKEVIRDANREIYSSHVINTGTVMFRKKDAIQTGLFNTRQRTCQDYDFWFRLLAAGSGVRVPVPCSIHRWHQTNYSWTDKQKERQQEWQAIRKKNRELRKRIEKHPFVEYCSPLDGVQEARVQSSVAWLSLQVLLNRGLRKIGLDH